MQKIKIHGDAPTGQPLHAHLEPVVDFLMANGNALAHAYRWGSNREGYFCNVAKPIDFNALREAFEFPETIILGIERNIIYCQRTGCIIQSEGDVGR